MSDTPASSDPAAPEQGSRVVRVFISSTFRDFGAERDLLMKRVFPELRRRARDRFVEILGIDLRWGITEEQSERGETLPICLREIECTRPYFIGLLGERYGWTPALGQYPTSLLEQQPWLRDHAGGSSVTELEILHGVLNAPEMAGRAYFYFRDPTWSIRRGFSSEGSQQRAKLERLKLQIHSSPCPVVVYSTPEDVAERITHDLWSLIDAQYPARGDTGALERERQCHETYSAERRHLWLGQDRVLAALLHRLDSANDELGESSEAMGIGDSSRARSAAARVTLITGESGSGKSALLANAIAKYRFTHPNDLVIIHHLAAGNRAADPAAMVKRLGEEIGQITGVRNPIGSGEVELRQQIEGWLSEASAWGKRQARAVIIVLDGLERLEYAASLDWLPRSIPPHVQLVVASLPGPSLDSLRRRGVFELEVPPLTREASLSYLFESIQNRAGKQLSEHFLHRIIQHPRSTLPLFLKLLVNQICLFGSNEGLSEHIRELLAAEDVDDILERVLFAIEADLGRDTIRGLLEALWATPEGMTEAELMSFTGVPPLTLSYFRLSLGDALHEADGMVMLSHEHIRKAINDRYLESDGSKERLHQRLGRWWEQQPICARMGFRVWFHYDAARAWDDLVRCMIDVYVGGAILSATPATLIVRSWEEIAASRGTTPVGVVISQAMSAVVQLWKSVPSDRHQRLAQLGDLADVLFLADSHELGLTIALHRLALARELASELATPESLRTLGDSLSAMGQVRSVLGDLDAAMGDHLESLEVRRTLVLATRSSNLECDVCESLELIGGILSLLDKWADALERFEESLGIRRRMLAQAETRQRLEDLSNSLGYCGKSCAELEDWRGALERYEESAEILHRLRSEEETPRCLAKLSSTLQDMGCVSERLGDLHDAITKHQASLAISRFLLAMAQSPQCLRLVADGYIHIGNICYNRADWQCALDHYEGFLELGDNYSFEDALDRPHALDLTVMCLHRVGIILESRSQEAAALKRFEECLDCARNLLRFGRTPDRLRNVSISLDNIGRIHGARANWAIAITLFEESLMIRRSLLTQMTTQERLRDVSISLHNVGRIHEFRGDLDAALAKYQEILEIARQLYAPCTAERDPEACNGVVWSAHLTGTCLIAMHRPVEALELLHTHAADAATLEAECGDHLGQLDTCAAFWETFSAACSATGDSTAAATYAARAAGLRARIAALTDEADDSAAAPPQ